MIQPRFDSISALIVDDNNSMCQLLGEMLHAIGVGQVARAADGGSACSLLQDHANGIIDFVIADLNMRPVNGADLLQWLRRDAASPNRFMPVIMLTGHTEFEKVVQLRDLGATEILAKPVNVHSLTHRLTSVIDRPRRFIDSDDYFGPDRRRQTLRFNGPDRRQTEPIN